MKRECAKYLHDVTELPILSQPKRKLRSPEYFNILLDPELSTKDICSRVPFSVHCNAVFIVNLNRLNDPKDVLVDDMGVWQWKGSYRVWASVDDGEVVVAGKDRPQSKHIYQLWQRYYENRSSPDVKKYVALLQGERCKEGMVAVGSQ